MAKIGVFDSGVGGMTVLKELVASFPAHSFLYYGDTAHVPYGSKSIEQITELSCQAALKLKNAGVHLIVVACNTASSVAIESMRASVFPLPVYGVVEGGVNAVLNELNHSSHKRVLVLGTKATIESGVYGRELRIRQNDLEVKEIACPLFVPMIEEGMVDHPLLDQTIAFYLESEKNEGGLCLLGCTHYPLIEDSLNRYLKNYRLINSGKAVAEILNGIDFLKPDQKVIAGAGKNQPVEFLFSGALPALFHSLSSDATHVVQNRIFSSEKGSAFERIEALSESVSTIRR